MELPVGVAAMLLMMVLWEFAVAVVEDKISASA
jgi:hypothetical protein